MRAFSRGALEFEVVDQPRAPDPRGDQCDEFGVARRGGAEGRGDGSRRSPRRIRPRGDRRSRPTRRRPLSSPRSSRRALAAAPRGYAPTADAPPPTGTGCVTHRQAVRLAHGRGRHDSPPGTRGRGPGNGSPRAAGSPSGRIRRRRLHLQEQPRPRRSPPPSKWPGRCAPSSAAVTPGTCRRTAPAAPYGYIVATSGIHSAVATAARRPSASACGVRG